MSNQREELLCKLFKQHFGSDCERIDKLEAHASARSIYRLHGGQKDAIGVYHQDRSENQAFIEFARHFRSAGLPVPEIFASLPEEGVYLQESLGHETLLDRLKADRKSHNALSDKTRSLYLKAVSTLPNLQIAALDGLPFELCTPTKAYDETAIDWDLNTFVFSFLRPLGILPPRQELSAELQELKRELLSTPSDFFLHRDFQSRNIVVSQDEVGFIDFQNGMRGPLQYDLASLLYQGSANLSDDLRAELLDAYCKAASQFEVFDEKDFRTRFPSFALMFLLKVLGTYGVKGLYERKLYFLKAIDLAVNNLAGLFKANNGSLGKSYPTLEKLVHESLPAVLSELGLREPKAQEKLTVEILSFSYRNGIPQLNPLHGGGFVFDCRYLPNPHEDPTLRPFTGRDKPIVEYFASVSPMQEQLQRSKDMILEAISSYKTRGYNRLAVSFGCTGGKHRSVYLAEQLFKFLEQQEALEVTLSHRELAALSASADAFATDSTKSSGK